MNVRMFAPTALVFLTLAAPANVFGQDVSKLYKKTEAAVVRVTAKSALGTGFVVNYGYCVITCAHVVGDAKCSDIRIPGTTVVQIEKAIDGTDAVLLFLNKPLKPFLTLASGPAPSPGTAIFVVGSPLGFLDRSISSGIVSGIRREGDGAYLQITAPISPGSSGSPVLTADGKVVGLVRGTIKDGQALNFAISSFSIRQAFFPLFAGTERSITLGRIAKAKTATKIYAKTSARSMVYYVVEPGDYLVVNKPNRRSAWVSVLMSNMTSGFALADSIQLLPEEYKVDKTKAQRLDSGPSPASTLSKLAAQAAFSLIGEKMNTDEFLRKTFASSGLKLPETLVAQVNMGAIVARLEDLEPGDRLYFWDDKLDNIGSAGIYWGAGNFIYVIDGVVKKEYLGDSRWMKHLVAARRS